MRKDSGPACRQAGQVVILLLLIMVIALAIGLSTIGRSILEVSTSRKSEDSSRAFSAAEAGIEQAIKQNEDNLGGATGVSVSLIGGQTQVSADAYGLPIGTNALGYSSRTKSDFAQFWLASPVDGTRSYTGTSFYIYFGDPNPKIGYFSNTDMSDPNNPINDQPAIEVNIIYWDGSGYKVAKQYFDSKQTFPGIFAARIGVNPSCDPSYPAPTPTPIPVNNDSANYYCKVTANFADFVPPIVINSTTFPIMARVRLLYTKIAHPIAIKPNGGVLPLQANIYSASGASGDVKRKLEVAAYRAVMPQYFDYAVFSAATFLKQQ